jgi:hypothetical protein
MLHNTFIKGHKVSSQLFPLPLSLFLFSVLELEDKYNCAQPIGEIFPTPPPFPLWWGWIDVYGVDCEIR